MLVQVHSLDLMGQQNPEQLIHQNLLLSSHSLDLLQNLKPMIMLVQVHSLDLVEQQNPEQLIYQNSLLSSHSLEEQKNPLLKETILLLDRYLDLVDQLSLLVSLKNQQPSSHSLDLLLRSRQMIMLVLDRYLDSMDQQNLRQLIYQNSLLSLHSLEEQRNPLLKETILLLVNQTLQDLYQISN